MKTLQHISVPLLVAVFSLIVISCEKTEPDELFIEGSLKSALVSEEIMDDAITVFGPEIFNRSKGKPQTIIREIQIEEFEKYKDTFIIVVENGDDNGDSRVSSAVIKVNNEVIFDPSHFSNKVSSLAQVLTLGQNVKIEIEIRGAPNSYFQVTILGWHENEVVTDIDGNVYQTVKIGNQVWMAENLKVTHYADGTPIPFVSEAVEWYDASSNGKAYCWYGYIEDISNPYGALYNWEAAMNGAGSSDYVPSGVQGVCPSGWHLPSDEEWKIMEMYLGMSREDADIADTDRGTDEAGKLKEAGTVHWLDPNVGATNETGFTALPASQVHPDGRHYTDNRVAFFWTATKPYPQDVVAFDRWFHNYDQQISRDGDDMTFGFSVRCVKD